MDPIKFAHDSQVYIYQPPNVRQVYLGPPPEKPFEVKSAEKSEKAQNGKEKKKKDSKEPREPPKDSPFGLI